MCHQDDWSTQYDEDIVVTSPDFLDTAEELKCSEGHFIDGIQFDTQEEREEPEYHLAFKHLSFTIESTSLVSLSDPTIDGTSCIEKDMAPTEPDPGDPDATIALTPEDLMITFKVPNDRYHYVKGIVIQKRGDLDTPSELLTEFTI